MSAIVVTWSTLNDTESVVEYSINSTKLLRATGSSTKFVDGGPLKATQYIHRVTLAELQPRSRYSELNLSYRYSRSFYPQTILWFQLNSKETNGTYCKKTSKMDHKTDFYHSMLEVHKILYPFSFYFMLFTIM